MFFATLFAAPTPPPVSEITTPSVLFLADIMPWIFIIFLVVVLFLIWLYRIFRQLYHMQEAFKKVVLSVTVPKDSADNKKEQKQNTQEVWRQDIAVAETLFAAIAGIRAERSVRSYLWGRQDHLALEIAAVSGMIYFYVVASRHMVRYIEQQIEAQYPAASIEEVHDYNVFLPRGEAIGTVLKFRRPFFFPIKTYREIDSDPMMALTNALSRLGHHNAVVQIVLRSAKKSWHWHGQKTASLMHQGKTLREALRRTHPNIIYRVFGVFLETASRGVVNQKKKESNVSNPMLRHQLTALEQEMTKRLEQKTSKGGLDANIRLIVSAPTKREAEASLQNLTNAFNQYNLYQYGNGFAVAHRRNQKALMSRFNYRHYARSERVLLNTEELASIYHFPLPNTETPNIKWLRAKKAPAPLNLPTEGILLGKNTYRGVTSMVRMATDDRRRHVYVIGTTGSGKSVLIGEMAKQDIAAGHGVCIVDPHGSLVDEVLESVPKSRADDVIYFDPSDTERPIGLNMLEAKTPAEMDFVTQEMIAIFYKLVTDPSMIGPMFEHSMRNAMFTLMADPDDPGTLAEIPRIFTDPAFQRYKVSKVTDPVVRAFWEKEMAKTTDFHKSEMLGYLISKVGRFVENSMMRNIIGQPKSGFNVRDIMDEGKILLVNLSKGKIGEINSNLLGLIIVSKLQMASFSRAHKSSSEIKDFFLYIDEFQNFVTDSIATILSEARKYRLNMTMAHQYIGQLVQGQDTKIKDAVLGNVGSIISFRIGVEDAEVIAKQFAPVFNEYDLVNIDRWHAYVKLLLNSSVTRPFDIDTLPPTIGSRDRAKLLKQLSRLKYGRDRAIVEAEILERSRIGETSTAPAEETAVRL